MRRCPRGATEYPAAAGRTLLLTAAAAALLSLLSVAEAVHAPVPAGWPIQRMTNFSGDILLGALFPVHERNATYECGRIQDEGVEQLEALLFTLHKINNDSALLPGISLGVLALDSCDSTEYALEQSLDFVKGFIARSSVGFACADGSSPAYRHGAFDRVVGVIGGQSSAVSIQLANLLRLFRVPQVSYQSTSPTLSNKHRFGYFFLLSGSPTIRTLALSFLLSLSGAVQTACLFAPKVYIALCKPAKNTREGVMSHHHGGRCPAVGCIMHPPLALNNLAAKADNLDNMAVAEAAAATTAAAKPLRGQSKTL